MTEVLQSIDRAMDAIKQQALSAGGGLTHQQRENLQKLQKHRQTVIEEHRMSNAPQLSQKKDHKKAQKATGQTKAVSNGGASVVKRQSSKSKRSAPPPPVAVPKQGQPASPPHDASAKSPLGATYAISPTPVQKVHSPFKKSVDFTGMASLQGSPMQSPKFIKAAKVNPELGTEMVELVRRNTQLSYEKSQVAVGTVLGHLKDNIPELSHIMNRIMDSFSETKSSSLPLEGAQDAERLELIFQELAAIKEDSQQRSWFLHEDEASICRHLEDLISITENANPEICKLVLAQDHYAAIDNMVLYYQMETRISIRLLLLQAFGALCSLHPQIIHELLNSVLPLELARDMQANTQDIQRLYFSATVLIMVFCMGEPIPFQHYEHLNEDFLIFLLNNIETPPECDLNEDIPDLYAKIILAYNLHFELPTDNLVMKTLAGQGTAKTFTEKLMLLVNRGDDPVRMFDHEPAPPNSMLKLLSDVYSSPTTACLLYTNDAMVLIDIVLRHLADLSAGEKMRTEYLSLFHLILENSDYGDHLHRRVELETCFNRISQEEGAESQMDIHIVRQIWKDFPQYFDTTV